MPVTTDDKQQSKSTTLPVSQLTIKKTLSLTSSQCKRPLTDKLSSGNFSSVFKLKVPRHSQDRESDVLFKSYGQSNAREIGNFQQGHRKQRKIQESVGATKSGSYKRRIMNRQQPHATLESEREKLETEEDKLGNCHNDPDHNVDTVWYKGLWWAVKKQAKKIANSNADADSSSDESVSNKTRVTKRPSGSTRNKHGKKLVSDENFIFQSSEGLTIESWEKVSYRKMVHVPPIDAFQPKQDVFGHFKLRFDNTTTSLKTGEKVVEVKKINLDNEERKTWSLLPYITTSSEKTGEKLVERRESTEASEGSTNRPIHPVDRHTTYNSEEDNRIVMRGSMVNENGFKVQDQQIPSSEANTDSSSDESLSSFESTLIRLYRNVIRNETSRMMSSIDMVGFEAKHLFGLERSRIFFDLLDEELFHFGSAGAISEFIPNMAESTVRQHVISFFEHAFGMTSRLMTLLSCPDSKSLKKMTEKEFISLMQCVIDSSSLKTKSNKGTKPSLKVTKGIKWIMVASEEFVRAIGGEIPEDVSYRLRHEDEMIVHGFIDTRTQPSDGKENRHIHYIYFPDDCRLFLYIPTEDGSYWHQLDMQRASRIR